VLDFLGLLWLSFTGGGAALGTLLGIAAAVALHWLFPGQDILFGQALLVAVGFFGGLVLDGSKDNQKE
jgi:hypothetical protein